MTNKIRDEEAKKNSPLRIAVGYVVVGMLWILLSDLVLSLLVKSASQLAWVQLAKGFFYVIITGVILYYLINSYRRAINKKLKELNLINRDLHTFIYKASHDLRGPIASLIGLSNLAMRETEDPELQQYLKRIYYTSGKLDGLLHELVHFISLKNSELSFGPVSPDDILREAMNYLQYVDGFKFVQFETDVEKLNNFYTDRLLLRSIILNLIENAIMFSTITDRAPVVRVDIKRKRRALQVIISDNGSGIPEEVQEHVFDMFYRGSAHSAGSGLGLYICRNLVDKLHGEIALQSKEGEGTTVTILIPEADRP